MARKSHVSLSKLGAENRESAFRKLPPSKGHVPWLIPIGGRGGESKGTSGGGGGWTGTEKIILMQISHLSFHPDVLLSEAPVLSTEEAP